MGVKRCFLGVDFTFKIKSNLNDRLLFFRYESQPKSHLKIVSNTFFSPFILLYEATITNKKSKINIVWSKIFYFESKRVKMCLQLYATMISS